MDCSQITLLRPYVDRENGDVPEAALDTGETALKMVKTLCTPTTIRLYHIPVVYEILLDSETK